MCRLLGFASDQKTNFQSLLGDTFQEFVDLSKIHCDGWGVAHQDHDQKVAKMHREPEMASKSLNFQDEISHLATDGALLHLRWATAGLSVKEENTHPFIYQNISFIHNGSIKPSNTLDNEIDPSLLALCKGETDSERYFYYLITQINSLGFINGIIAGVNFIRKNKEYSSINAMIMNEDYYVVISEYDSTKIPSIFTEDYYELRFKMGEHGIIVGSSGWNQSGWKLIPNHSALIYNRNNFELEIRTL